MLHAAWRSVVGRRVRLLLSAFSIVLGVAFVSGSLIFTNLLRDSFDELLKGQFADVNVTVADLGSDGQSFPTLIPLGPEVVDEISRVAGVAQATGVINSFNVYPMGADGRILAFAGAPGMGTNFHTTPAADGIEGLHIVAGAAPSADDQVVVDPATLVRGGFEVGGKVKVATPFDGVVTYTISGTATYSVGGTAGATYLFFTTHEAQRLFVRGADAFTGVWIATEPGVDGAEVAHEVSALVPDGFQVRTGEQLSDEFTKQLDVGLGFVNVFLLLFAAVALIVAALLILNTFSILVAQRSRELALLRALGATRAQVRDQVLFEAAVVALVGASLGIAGGWLLCWGIVALLGAAGMPLGTAVPAPTWQAVALSYALALLITAAAAWVPARRASATRPVEAMAAARETGPQPLAGVGAMIGVGLLQLGAAAIVCALWLDVPGPLYWAGAGSAAILVGMTLAAVLVGRPVVAAAAALYRRWFGEVGRLAALNAGRSPRRTAATAATLMIGLSLVTTVAILADSTTTSIREAVTKDQRGDFVVSPVNLQPFDAAVADRIEGIDGVDRVWRYARGAVRIGDEAVPVLGTTPDALADGTTVKVLGGELNASGDSVLLSYDVSSELDLPLGRRFQVPGQTGGTVDLLVTGVFDAGSYSPPVGMIVNPETYAQLGDPGLVSQLKVKLASGADASAVRKALDEATSDLPTVVVSDNAEYANSLVGRFSQLFAIMYALLALAIVISVLGIVNTLGLSLVERTREIGLLRAIGLTRPQLRRVVTLESVVVAVMGAVLGVVLGLVFGVLLVHLLRDSGIRGLSVPWLQLASYLALAVLAGVLAAIVPARRAARMDVLAAIAEE